MGVTPPMRQGPSGAEVTEDDKKSITVLSEHISRKEQGWTVFDLERERQDS